MNNREFLSGRLKNKYIDMLIGYKKAREGLEGTNISAPTLTNILEPTFIDPENDGYAYDGEYKGIEIKWPLETGLDLEWHRVKQRIENGRFPNYALRMLYAGLSRSKLEFEEYRKLYAGTLRRITDMHEAIETGVFDEKDPYLSWEIIKYNIGDVLDN